MDSYFAGVVLVEDLENLLVLRSVEVELIVLLHFLVGVLLDLLTANQATSLGISILIFIGDETRAHISMFHFKFVIEKS